MNASIMRESIKKITPRFALILAVLCLVLGLVQTQNKLSFAEICPMDLEAVSHCSVESESDTDHPKHLELTPEQGQELVRLLSELEYQTNGTASSLRFCYCRVFLTADGAQRQRVEIMLTDDMVLVNPMEPEAKSKVYRVSPRTAAVQEYINSLVG